METYPIAIIQDRYAGVYSSGQWLAIACATDTFNDRSRVDVCLESDEGPSGSDVEAGIFWLDPPSWIAVGNTPEQALANLRNAHE
jgi:hypothetical protein